MSQDNSYPFCAMNYRKGWKWVSKGESKCFTRRIVLENWRSKTKENFRKHCPRLIAKKLKDVRPGRPLPTNWLLPHFAWHWDANNIFTEVLVNLFGQCKSLVDNHEEKFRASQFNTLCWICFCRILFCKIVLNLTQTNKPKIMMMTKRQGWQCDGSKKGWRWW